MKQILLKKLYIWILLTINLLFSYIIGLSLPQLETKDSYILGFVMIPMLVILNYIILDRFHFYTKKLNQKEEKTSAYKEQVPEN
jgi:hypothetical protein